MSVNPLQPSNASERLWSDEWMCISERSGGCALDDMAHSSMQGMSNEGMELKTKVRHGLDINSENREMVEVIG